MTSRRFVGCYRRLGDPAATLGMELAIYFETLVTSYKIRTRHEL
jgi:hypothetical protein